MELFGVELPLWLMLTLALFYVTYKYTTSTFKAFEKSTGVRGPKPYPLIGTLHLMVKKGIIGHDNYLIEKYGKLVATWQGLQPTLLVADVDILKQIAIKEFHAFPDRVNPDFGPLGNKMVVVLKGEEWKRVRDLLSPTISGAKVRKMDEPIQRCCQTLVKNLSSSEKAVDIRDYTGAFSMDVIASTLFSLDIDSQSDPQNEFVRMANKVCDQDMLSPQLIAMLFFPSLTPLLSKFGQSLLRKESMDFFSAIVEKAISQRKDERSSRTDFLQMMIKAHEDEEENENEDQLTQTGVKKRGLSHDEVLAQCIIFILAGYVTVGNALTFLTYQLAVNTEIQEKLRLEISSQLDLENNPPTHDNVNKLEYLSMVVSESLRLDTVTGRSDRDCVQDVTINGVFFPKGIKIAIPIDWLHHDPEVWPDPEKFDPERFSAEAKASRNPYYYLPFGLGPRSCLGMRLALMEIKIAICFILLRLRIKTCPETDIPIRRNPAFGKPEACKLLFQEI